MPFILLDFPENHLALRPLTFTRPISELRLGILTIQKKWLYHFKEFLGYITVDYLQKKFYPPTHFSSAWVINSTILPNDTLVAQLKTLEENEALYNDNCFLGVHLSSKATSFDINSFHRKNFDGEFSQIKNCWDLFSLNEQEIKQDFSLLVKNSKSKKITDPYTVVYGENLFLSSDVTIRASVLNTLGGPIYIGKNANIQEGSLLVGPIAVCEGSTISLGAKIRPNTTIGPYSKVGGEVSNSIFQGYSNKVHDGYLGNSVVGEWCNLGANTTNSNLKNNYKNVKFWNYLTEKLEDTKLQFCGLMMGDYSKCGIGTTINTGTSIGVCANLYGAGLPPNFIPSFSWGLQNENYLLEKAIETNEIVLKKKNKSLTKEDISILEYIFNDSLKYKK